MNHLFFALFVVRFIEIQAQTTNIPVIYTVDFQIGDQLGIGLENVTVKICLNDSVFQKLTTDSLGFCSFSFEQPKDTNGVFHYKLEFDKFKVRSILLNEEKSFLFAIKDVKRSFHFVRSIKLPFYLQTLMFDNFMYCELNSENCNWNFKLDDIQFLLKAYPHVCLMATHLKHPNESKEIAEIRMNKLKQFVKNSGLDLSRFLFSYTFLELSKSELERDPRPRFEWRIESFDCQ